MSNNARNLSRRTMLGTLLAIPALVQGQLHPKSSNCESLDAAEARVRASLKGAKGTKLVLLGTGAGPLPGQDRQMQSSVLLHDGAAYLVAIAVSASPTSMREPAFPFLRSVRSSSPISIRITTWSMVPF